MVISFILKSSAVGIVDEAKSNALPHPTYRSVGGLAVQAAAHGKHTEVKTSSAS